MDVISSPCEVCSVCAVGEAGSALLISVASDVKEPPLDVVCRLVEVTGTADKKIKVTSADPDPDSASFPSKHGLL